MKIEKEITHVEIVKSINELNQKLENDYVLIETLISRRNDIDGFDEIASFIIGC